MKTGPTTPCDAARIALWPDPARPGPAEARDHYDACPECQRFFRVQSALGKRLHRLTSTPAPEGLRQRVVADLGRARRRPVRPVWIGVGLAAAAALALAVALRPPGDDALAMPFVAQVRDDLAQPATFRSNDLAQVEAWLAGQVGEPVELPDITGATIVGGRITRFGDRPVPIALYEMHGLPVTFFAMPDVGTPPALSMEAGIQMARSGSWEVAVWAEPAGTRVVAAPMTRDEIRAIARECREMALMGVL